MKKIKLFIIVIMAVISIICVYYIKSLDEVTKMKFLLDETEKITIQKEGSIKTYTITNRDLISEIITTINEVECKKRLLEKQKGYIYRINITANNEYNKIVLHKRLTQINQNSYESDNTEIINEIDDIFLKIENK